MPAAAAQSKKLRLVRARRRRLNMKNGFVAIPCPVLHARACALPTTMFDQIITRFVRSLVRRK